MKCIIHKWLIVMIRYELCILLSFVFYIMMYFEIMTYALFIRNL